MKMNDWRNFENVVANKPGFRGLRRPCYEPVTGFENRSARRALERMAKKHKNRGGNK